VIIDSINEGETDQYLGIQALCFGEVCRCNGQDCRKPAKKIDYERTLITLQPEIFVLGVGMASTYGA